MTDAESTLLSVRGLGKTFRVGGGFASKQLRALSEIEFELERGEVLGLVGESGSGKSTLARIIARLIQPSEGTLLFAGEDVLNTQPKRATLAYRRQVQMIFQDPFGSLNPTRTVGHHLERPLLRHERARRGSELKRAVEDLLETVGLVPPEEIARKYPHELSGGQRQRVAIARALAVEPELILADEPTSMLDVSIRMGILNLLSKLRKERGIAYLYITHDLASARYFTDRVMVMYAGHIVESAPSDRIFEQARHPYTQLLLSAVPRPDGALTAPLAAKGGTPKLIEPGPGCPFAARCPQAHEPCRRSKPEATEPEPGQRVRCFAAEVSGK